MDEIEIERLPAMLAHPPAGVPQMTRDNTFSTRELEGLASEIFLWLQRSDPAPGADIPKMPLLSTSRFQSRYGRAFDPDSYLDRLVGLFEGLYPVHETLFRADSARFFEACCTKVRIHTKPAEDRVYWKREIARLEEGAWLPGYCGVLDEAQWEDDRLRPAYEKELTALTAYLFAQAGSLVQYPAPLFYTASGWPLAIRIR